MKKKIIISTSLLLLFFLYMAIRLFSALPLGNKPIEFEIKRGSTFRQAVDALADKGLARDRWVILLMGKITGIDHKIKAGYYTLWGSMSPYEIFTAIRKGKVIEYELTVVPGDSLLEIAEKFSATGITDAKSFIRLCSDSSILDAYDVDAPSLEGYLFPDTYKFPKGLDAEEVISLMVNRLWEKYDADMLWQTYEMGLTERELLTMASIIEKEAVVDEERPIIAAVYYNRLKKKMPLQADPTATYGIKSSKEKIYKKDLLRKTSYNTYVIKGLPPGPIASPGFKSIEAALNPEKAPYLYFVSNNDGTHKFSETLTSHNQAVTVYRGKKKSRNKSSSRE